MSSKKETTNPVVKHMDNPIVLNGFTRIGESPAENPYELNTLKRQIEMDVQEKVRHCIKHSNTPTLGKSLVEIMQKGAHEFKQKTGRNMTYSEMREMYG